MAFEDGLLRQNTVDYDGPRFVRQVDPPSVRGVVPDRALVAAFNSLTRIEKGLRR